MEDLADRVVEVQFLILRAILAVRMSTKNLIQNYGVSLVQRVQGLES